MKIEFFGVFASLKLLMQLINGFLKRNYKIYPKFLYEFSWILTYGNNLIELEIFEIVINLLLPVTSNIYWLTGTKRRKIPEHLARTLRKCCKVFSRWEKFLW